MLQMDTGSSNGSSQASSALTRGHQHLQTFESTFLPVLFSLTHQYPLVLTVIAYVIEMLQCLAFVLNPYSPLHRMTVAIIYMTQFPFWDGQFTRDLITYNKFLGFYWTLVAIVVIILCLFAIGAVYTHQLVNFTIKFRIYHVVHFLLSVFFIPTFQTLLSAFVCQKRLTVSKEVQGAANTENIVFKEHVVFFANQSCTDTMTKVNMGVSIVLLIAWGIFSYIALLTVIPVDREDGSIRSRCNTTVDIFYYVYRAGLCVCFFLTQAYNLTSVNAFVVAGFSLVMMVMYSLYLPFYSELTNRLTTMWFGVIFWSGITVGITILGDTEILVQQNGTYAILVIGCIIMAIIGYWISGIRYNRTTKFLFSHITDTQFVPLEHNPFAIAAFQRNFDLLPFPAGLPTTDVRFSPYHQVTKGIIEEALREEAQIESDRLAAESGVSNPETDASAALAAIAGVDDDASPTTSGAGGGNNKTIDEVLAKEGMRRQVVSPTLSRAILPSDAEVSVRFLSKWQVATQMFPTPYMVYFASRMMNRFMLKHRRDSMVVIAYISFLCDYAPGLGRMTMCVDIMRQCTRELTMSVTERYLFYYFSLHVKEALGIRNAMHQILVRHVRSKHQRVLLRTTLVWRNLMEDVRSPMSLYSFTNGLAMCRYQCYNMYTDSLRTTVDDESLLRNYGLFMEEVYRFKHIGVLCNTVADTIARLQLMRLQRTFNDIQEEDQTVNAKEELTEVKPDAAAQEEMDVASELNSAGSRSVASQSVASSGTRVSSLCTSDGRSSQSKVRNGKRFAAQMVDRVQEMVDSNFKTLQAHLHWGLLTASSIGSTILLLCGIFANGAVALVIFSKFMDFERALQGVAQSRYLCESMLVQFYKTCNLLPTDSAVGLTVEQTGFLKGNVTYLRVLIDATEAAHTGLFYGDYTVRYGALFSEMTAITHFFRVYITDILYSDISTSFLTHMPMIFSVARSLAAQLEEMPTYQDFMSTTDVFTLSENVIVTAADYFDKITDDIGTTSSAFFLSSVIFFAVSAAVFLVIAGAAVYLLLWNYRRAASMIAKELHLFTIIPRDSVKRVAAESQKRLDAFIYASVQGNQNANIDEQPVQEITQTDMARSFGVNDHASSVKLLSHLIEHGAITSRSQSVVEADDGAPLPPAVVTITDVPHNGSTSSLPATLEQHGSRTHLDMEGGGVLIHQVKPTLTSGRPSMIGSIGADPLTDDEGGDSSSHDEANSLRLLNVFNYEELEADGMRKFGDRRVSNIDSNDDEENNDQAKEGGNEAAIKEAEVMEDNNKKGATYPILFASLTSVAGLAFLMVSLFAMTSLHSHVQHSHEVVNCMREVGNATGSANYLAARFIAGEVYEDYILATKAIVDAYTYTEDCRAVLISSEFFDAQSAFQEFSLIALSLIARNVVDVNGPNAKPAYAMVVDREWRPFPQSAFYAKLLSPYLTREQLETWAPFTTSAQDGALNNDARQELARQTLLGPFSMAMMESMVDSFRTMLSGSVVKLEEEITAKFNHFQVMEGVAVACWVLSLLSAIATLIIRTRMRSITFLLVLYSFICVVATVIGIVCIFHVKDYVEKYRMWLSEVIDMDSSMWEFARMIMFSTSFTLIDEQRSLLVLQNMTTANYLRDFDAAFFPQPNAINKYVFFSSFAELAKRKTTFFHYAWLAVVCTIYGRGQETQYLSDTEVSYVRWDLSEDPLVNRYKILYTTDTYLTTFQENVVAPPTGWTPLLYAQGFLNSRMMRDLAAMYHQRQAMVMEQLDDSYIATVDRAYVNADMFQWAHFYLTIAALVIFFVVVGILAISSIRAYSRTQDERIVYRAAFSGHVRIIVSSIVFVLLILIAVNIACIFFCRESNTLITVGNGVLSVMYLPTSGLAITMSLASWTEYFFFVVGQERLRNIMRRLEKAYPQAYLDTKSAVRMRKGQDVHLFGGVEPYTDFSLVSSTTLRAAVCVDPTNPVNGNQQPMLIQVSVLMDVIRSVAHLPTAITFVRESINPFVDDALSRIGSVQYAFLENYEASVKTMDDDYVMFKAVTISLLCLAAVITIVIYFVLLRRIDITMRQQSIGSKLLLLGLPDDVLNTVPEIKEFYDPEAGSSNDQFKRKLQQSEKLLQNILPPNISRRLKNGERVIADNHPSVTVVFASLQGFEEYSHRLDPKQRVEFLNGIVVAFDHIVDLLDLEKIKTVGDIYFFCGGLTKKTERDHAVRCMECSLFFFQALDDHNSRHGTPNIKLRIGINTDPAVAGVIGNKKVAYDLWGDSVNTASRMYSTGIPGRIQVSENTFKKVKQYYAFEDRHVQAKGKGTLPTHVYTNRLKNTAYTELNWRVASN